MPKSKSIQYVAGDMFPVLKADKGKTPIYIPHVCNDKGAFGAGFVVPLSKAFPETQQSYHEWHKGKPKDVAVRFGSTFELGHTQFVLAQETPRFVVCNMVAQTLGGPRPIFYNHLVACMETVAQKILDADPRAVIMCPAFGSGLAGGNWDFIAELIKDTWIKRNIPVTVYYLPGTLNPPQD